MTFNRLLLEAVFMWCLGWMSAHENDTSNLSVFYLSCQACHSFLFSNWRLGHWLIGVFSVFTDVQASGGEDSVRVHHSHRVLLWQTPVLQCGWRSLSALSGSVCFALSFTCLGYTSLCLHWAKRWPLQHLCLHGNLKKPCLSSLVFLVKGGIKLASIFWCISEWSIVSKQDKN